MSALPKSWRNPDPDDPDIDELARKAIRACDRLASCDRISAKMASLWFVSKNKPKLTTFEGWEESNDGELHRIVSVTVDLKNPVRHSDIKWEDHSATQGQQP